MQYRTMASRSAYILGGVAVVAAVVGVVVALKVRQDSELRREQEDSKSSDPSPSNEKRAVPGGSDSVTTDISRDETSRVLAQPSAGAADLVLQEEVVGAKTNAQTAQATREQEAEVKPRSSKIASVTAVDQAEPFAPSAAAKEDSALPGFSKVSDVATPSPVAASSLEESVVVVSKEQAKLEDSFVQVTKPETDATPKGASATGDTSPEPDPAFTPKRTSRRNRRSKKNANLNSPTGTATLLDTSLDVSVSSEGVVAAAAAAAAVGSPGGVDGDNNPQDDSNGGGGGGGAGSGGGNNDNQSSPTKDLSAIAKSHQKSRKHNRGGPKSAAAAAAVKEIQSSTVSSATKKKNSRNRTKGGSAASKAASPHH
jgi:hypothetical protein